MTNTRRFAPSAIALLLLAGCAASRSAVSTPPTGPEPKGITQTITAVVHRLPEMDTVYTQFPAVTAAFADEEHGWMVVDFTQLMATTDGGHTWQPAAQFDDSVRRLSFSSATRGWAFTDQAAFRTDDGGHTWHQEAPGQTSPRLEFRNAELGWYLEQAGGNSPSFLHLTGNGGSNWVTLPTPCKPGFQASAVSFISPESGFLICSYFQGSGGASKWLYRTADGGTHWQLITGTIYGKAQPDFPPGVSVEPTAATPLGLLPTGYGALSIDFPGEQHGFFLLRQGPDVGYAYETADGGRTWTRLPVPPGDQTGQFRFFTPTFGRILVNDGQQWAWLETRDGGASWQQLFPSVAPLLAIRPVLQFPDAEHGVAARTLIDPSAILTTADGGRTWEVAGSMNGDGITSLSFVDAQNGWAGAWHDGPRLYRTRDGGKTWSRAADGGTNFTPVPGDSVTDPVRFQDARSGWRLHEGKLLTTADGGATWQPLPLSDTVAGFDLRPGGTAWLIAVGGPPELAMSLLATRDDGRSWVRILTPGIGPATVTCADSLHAWLTDNKGHLYRTADGGHTWEQVL